MLRTLGLLFIAIIVAAVVGFGFWLHLDRQAREFVIAVTPIIYKTWNADALTHRSIGMLQTPDYEAQVSDMFQMFSPHLGPLESAQAPDGTLRYGRADPKLSRGLYGKYTSQVKFREAEATLEFSVIKEQGAWRIAGFRISSPAVLEAMKKQPPAQMAGANWVRGPPDEEASVLAEAEEILRIMDSEDPGATWNRASLVFQQTVTKRRFVADMKRLRDKTGHTQNRKLQGVGFMFNRPNATPPGDYAIADFVSTYSRATLEERLGFYKREGKWEFSAHKWTRIDKEQR
jgi:hypothetical protein